MCLCLMLCPTGLGLVWVGLVALSQPVWFVSAYPLISVGWDADLLLALLCLLIRQVTSGQPFLWLLPDPF